MTTTCSIQPRTAPFNSVARVPGSKSITNRALLCAALADGRSTVTGALQSDDTAAMIDCLRRVGVDVQTDDGSASITVSGDSRGPSARSAKLDVCMSGTTARFITPFLALGHGEFEVNARGRMRERPMRELRDALEVLGGEILLPDEPAFFPLTVAAHGLKGGTVRVAGHQSSQFLSGLLLSGPAMRDGISVTVTTELVSRPYVDLTLAVLSAFGAVAVSDSDQTFRVAPGALAARTYAVEPDASAASYFFAAAAIVGGRVRVEGLSQNALQGDVGFVDILERMGARIVREADAIEVHGGMPLSGVEVDMSQISDTAQTLAVVAPFATSPTRVTGIGFIRRKETDRIRAVVTELQRAGVDARAEDDGFVIHPAMPKAAAIQTYDDHRMAMAFALLGLRVPGIEIEDPDCVRKTFPRFFDVLAGLK